MKPRSVPAERAIVTSMPTLRPAPPKLFKRNAVDDTQPNAADPDLATRTWPDDRAMSAA